MPNLRSPPLTRQRALNLGIRLNNNANQQGGQQIVERQHLADRRLENEARQSVSSVASSLLDPTEIRRRLLMSGIGENVAGVQNGPRDEQQFDALLNQHGNDLFQNGNRGENFERDVFQPVVREPPLHFPENFENGPRQLELGGVRPVVTSTPHAVQPQRRPNSEPLIPGLVRPQAMFLNSFQQNIAANPNGNQRQRAEQHFIDEDERQAALVRHRQANLTHYVNNDRDFNAFHPIAGAQQVWRAQIQHVSYPNNPQIGAVNPQQIQQQNQGFVGSQQIFRPVAVRSDFHPENYGDNFNAGHPEQQNFGQQRTEQIQITNLEYVLTLDRLPELKGNEGADKVKNFFKKFSNATEEWPEHKRVKALETKVSGRAERAFNADISSGPHRFDSIRRAIQNQLEETDCREMGAFDELMSGVKRRSNENLDALADRIQSLVSRAYPGLTQNLCDDYAIKHFIRALANPELSLTLEMSRKSGMSFDEFVALAARAESIQRATRVSSNENKYSDNRNRGFYSSNNFSRPQSSEFQGNSQQPRGRVVCYNCNEPGHLSRDCNQHIKAQRIKATKMSEFVITLRRVRIL
ncbi:hypothetical protein niasHT_033199 [Heterodera trifolii]|uniref:CCHC-type domain-containing protein n=1 Tax=Heterodera trifolii TaxID=157864 RepID=A0ABD2HS29_9BILA